MMLRAILRAAALLSFSLAFIAPATADDDAKLVESVPPEVADVVTGGSWSAGEQGGLYRAFVVMTDSGGEFGARVFLQWLSLSDDSPVPSVVKTVPIKEVNDQNLPNASIEIDAEEDKDNQIMLVVSGYDFDADKDILLFVKAGEPGVYSMEKTPPKSLDAGPPGDAESPGEKE